MRPVDFLISVNERNEIYQNLICFSLLEKKDDPIIGYENFLLRGHRLSDIV